MRPKSVSDRSSSAGAVAFAALVFVGFPWMAESANLITNPGFEQTPCVTPCNQSQGVMPSGWLVLNVTPDTYSNDGSYGLGPEAFGNFIGATAQEGIRWVAGWSIGPEIFGQSLAAALTPGRKYTLSAYLREAVRVDLANPGTYQVELWDPTGDVIVIGSFQPPVANQQAWELRTLAFTAPSGANTHTVLAFRPVSSAAGGGAYPGIDNLVLQVSATPIAIDIRPGTFPNPVNPKSSGRISVAILTTNPINNITTFDATMVDRTSVRFGATGSEAAPVHATQSDVDGDGDVDLVLQFDTERTGIACGATKATLTGRTRAGEPFSASDAVVTVGCAER
jgi:hypothetical protein